MRILVTGGAGFVGGFAARHLHARGHHVRALDDLSQGHQGTLPRGMLVEGDIADGEALRELLGSERIDAVMHFAASCSVGESVREPERYWRNNVEATRVLLAAMADRGVRRLVFSSSCAVYSEDAAMPLTEDAPLAPASPYAETKLEAERMILESSRTHGLRHAILRYFNAAGADPDGQHGEDHDPETHLIPLAIQAALGRREGLEVYGDDYPTPDGTCVRDYVHVADLARAHESALAVDSGAFNLGSGTGHSVLEVIRCVERVTKRRVRYRVVERRPGDTARLVASSARAQAELGWTPEYADLERIVASACAWHQGHPGGYGD